MTIIRIAALALIGLSVLSTADAQERKCQSDRQREQQERTSRPSYGGNSCIGGTFLIRDGESVSCSLPDGRICTVTAGTSGNAVISNCK